MKVGKIRSFADQILMAARFDDEVAITVTWRFVSLHELQNEAGNQSTD
jgi:hypothetical protein